MENALFIKIDVNMIKYELFTMWAVEIIYERCCMVCMGLDGVTMSVGNLDSLGIGVRCLAVPWLPPGDIAEAGTTCFYFE